MITPQALPVRQRPRGVLIADDEADIREVLRDKLRQVGFSVWLAADGQQALDLYRSHRDTIDVALLDVCMPGLDGPQTLAALRRITPHVCCCFMSGYLGNYSEETLRGLGVASVFAKPFRLEEVTRVLGKLASQTGEQPGARRRSSCVHAAYRRSKHGGAG